jgi:cytoskeletal protein RodZ
LLRERLRRRLGVVEASQATKIHVRLIEAIESDDYRALPAPVYATGLIRTYARYLGVDPEPLVRAYKAQAADTPTPAIRAPTARVAPQSGGLPGLIAPMLVVALLVALGGYLYQQYAAFVAGASVSPVRPVVSGIAVIPTPLASTPIPTVVAAMAVRASPTRPAPTAAAPTPVPPTATPMPLPTATASPTAITGVHVDALASARVWLQVEADGKVVFSGILNQGDRRAWSAQQKLMIWAGNAGSVSVTYNGKSVGVLGRPGEVVKVTWTATTT